MKLSEMDDKFLILYLAYVIDKLDTWRNEAYGRLDDKARDDLFKIWPCNIDSMKIYVEAIKRGKPEMYSKGKSLRHMFEEVEEYIKQEFEKEN